VEVVSERASTGRARPELEELLRRARGRAFDAIVVAAFDRFARSALELILALDEFRALGIDFLSVRETIDTSTPLGRAVFTILAAVAELEKALISERTKEKLALLRAKGVRLGRPRVHVDMDQARRLVLKKRLSVRKLARALGVSSGTAAKIRLQVLAGEA
jgi:DNA invertase Pin-like site-specific DNA recombinase